MVDICAAAISFSLYKPGLSAETRTMSSLKSGNCLTTIVSKAATLGRLGRVSLQLSALVRGAGHDGLMVSLMVFDGL